MSANTLSSSGISLVTHNNINNIKNVAVDQLNMYIATEAAQDMNRGRIAQVRASHCVLSPLSFESDLTGEMAVEKMFDILKQISAILQKEPKVIHLPAIPDRQRQLQGKFARVCFFF